MIEIPDRCEQNPISNAHCYHVLFDGAHYKKCCWCGTVSTNLDYNARNHGPNIP